MTRLTKCFRGISLFAALIGAMVCGQAQASGVTDAKGWLRTFNDPIGEAYILKPLSAFGTGPAISDVYIEVIHTKRGVSELVSFEDGLVLGVGCFINSDRDQERPQHIACQKQAHKNIAQKKLTLPECHLDKDEGGYPRTATYFITHQGTRAACIYKMPAQSDDQDIKSNHRGTDDLLIIKIQPIWKDDQLEKNRPNNTGLLNHFFSTAPISQLSRIGQNGARDCHRLPDSLSAFAAGATSTVYASDIPFLRRQDLLWSYFYLVRSKKRIACADLSYDVDILNVPIAYGLSGGTILIRGQRHVLRIDVSTGNSLALSTLVKRISSQTFIETMQTDGQEGCRDEREVMPCKWLVQQGWYNYVMRNPGGNAGELYYSKYWFQGFDNAIKSIFLMN